MTEAAPIPEGKLYYTVFTEVEKIWVYADYCDIKDGTLIFYDIEGDNQIVVLALQQGYWRYAYESDPSTGESIQSQIPFWKKHERPQTTPPNTPQVTKSYKPNRQPY